MNGIHEVTGSIPVWSTNLRSRVPTCVSYGWQAKRRLPTEAQRAKVGLAVTSRTFPAPAIARAIVWQLPQRFQSTV